jgi:hypothetical protein
MFPRNLRLDNFKKVVFSGEFHQFRQVSSEGGMEEMVVCSLVNGMRRGLCEPQGRVGKRRGSARHENTARAHHFVNCN